MRYFAYGTNVNLEIFARKRLAFQERCRATLPDYALRFNKRNLRRLLPAKIGFANIEPSAGGEVEGVLYRMADEALARLDELERCPEHYERIEVDVSTELGMVSCLSYQAQPDKTAEDLLPSRNYINHILAERQCLSAGYRERLQQLETYSGQCAACQRVASVFFHKEGQQMFVLCPPCLEAKRIWGETLGRPLTVLDTESVMAHLRRTGQTYDSVLALIEHAVQLGVLAPHHKQAAT